MEGATNAVLKQTAHCLSMVAEHDGHVQQLPSMMDKSANAASSVSKQSLCHHKLQVTLSQPMAPSSESDTALPHLGHIVSGEQLGATQSIISERKNKYCKSLIFSEFSVFELNATKLKGR